MHDREVGWSEGPIPWSAIERYAEANDIEGDQREDLHFHVRALDRAYLEWRRKKKPADETKEPGDG